MVSADNSPMAAVDEQATFGMTQEIVTARLRQMVILNEGAKQILLRAVAVDLLAIDALIRSSNGGRAVPGFEAASVQMRRWTKDLRRQVQALTEASACAVATLSLQVKRAARQRLLQAAGAVSEASQQALAAPRRQLEEAVLETESALAEQRHRLGLHVRELGHLAFMATVLARAAMIEAAYGEGDLRASLGHVADAFADSAGEVDRTIGELRRVLHEVR